MKDVKFVFENLNDYRNFVNCPDKNPSGILRFTPSPVVTTMIRYQGTKTQFDDLDFSRMSVHEFSPTQTLKNYIIASGVTHSPHDWCGPCADQTGFNSNAPENVNVFDLLNKVYLKDLRDKNAYLLLDQTHEGYHTPWLFGWFHTSCREANILPTQIIYITGNLTVQEQYDTWCKENKIAEKMLVIPEAHFEQCVFTTILNRIRIDNKLPLPTLKDNLRYKEKNLDTIFLYNLLQKRPRAHRSWMFKEIVENDLLRFGINSMNEFNLKDTYYFHKHMLEEEYEPLSKLLPILPRTAEPYEKELRDFVDMDSGKYQMRFNEDILLDSWISVISEASFGEETCFISEKTFKVIGAGHPFIIFGNRHSLRVLQEMGYETFHPFIDESYDSLDTWERLSAIIQVLRTLSKKSPTEMIEWYKSIEGIIKHNKDVLRDNSTRFAPNSATTIFNYIGSTNNA